MKYMILTYASQQDVDDTFAAFLALAETAVVKRGSRGVEVRTAEGVEEHVSLGSAVVDTTGAGDALAAGFLVDDIELGLEAAARCVGQLGAVP